MSGIITVISEEEIIEDNRTVWVILSDQIEELYEKVREIYYLGQTDIADSFKVRIYILAHYYATSHVDDSNVLHSFCSNVYD